ncbi:hypothetical protein ABGN05_16820 [Aquibium sp. LZ166]|uniref:Uncharacterized protein n=1 Tax=Aquibium pacificus TaxID=3153579 RepID=A0ABV3SKL6_9HYPH
MTLHPMDAVSVLEGIFPFRRFSNGCKSDPAVPGKISELGS